MITVCLCGSTRFERQFKEASRELSKFGIIVHTLGSFPSDNEVFNTAMTPADKVMFDLVYFEKIRLSDAVLVIDADQFDTDGVKTEPYIGFSTAREILYAKINEKPIFGLAAMHSWYHVYEALTNRWDESFTGRHNWIAGHAAHVLSVHDGVDVVKSMMADSVHSIMTAALSVIAGRGDPYSSSFATCILEAVGADPIENVDLALSGVVGIPADYCGLRPQNEGDAKPTGPRSDLITSKILQAQDPVEEMVTLERRRLVGTVIMMQAVGNMLSQRGPKLKREEAIEKLDMAVQTCIDSFGLSYTEIDEARSSTQL